MTTINSVAPVMPAAVDDRLRHVLDLHLHPRHGSRFWLEREAAMGIDLRDAVRTVADLARCGDMSPHVFSQRPLLDFVPRCFHDDMSRFTIGQTGGATGPGGWTAYRHDEFQDAFITPFIAAARHLRFPTRAAWLYIGPSGPHIIGKVVSALAAGMHSHDPFSVDFDPRWARRLPDGSFAQRRYLDHVIDQALAVIRLQAVEVLFTTPAVIARLAERMSEEQRGRIRGIHYGGMPLPPDTLHHLQHDLFPHAIHLAGYGNTLFGCCLELSASAGRDLDYYPWGDRLLLQTNDEQRVLVTRLDESVLIVRMLERDEGQAVAPPPHAPDGFHLPGIRNPHSPVAIAPRAANGLY